MVEIKNITKKYKNGAGIENINITLKEGTITGLIGDNGAGKTTLIKSIFKEIKKDSGDVLFDGKSIFESKKTSFSYFPDQSSYPEKIKIFDFMVYYANLNGFSIKEAKQKTEYLLNYFNLLEYKNNFFDTLSAGMQKRALLAISLIIKPKVLFLDEPTANLDMKARIEVIELLKELVKNEQITILITSHLIDELDGFIDNLYILEEGKIIFNKQLEKNDDIKQIYLNSTKKSDRKEKLKL